jgi:hypothetical protein
MVACEITRIRKIKMLFLVGSATSKNEVSAILEILHPLAAIAPIDWLRFSAGKVPHDLARMFSEANPSFIRMMCSAVFNWQGLPDSDTRIYRIHGKYDLVIPSPRNPDLSLKGGHLISMTHANECVEFIRRQLERQ